MLKIKNISKTYKTGTLVQRALNNVSLNLRNSEFVAILGPSGSGKTTLLNIIGGLDHYDSGDLQINNISTKNYKDKDWDAYRNHTIGFVFQSYNLIPHQTILSNVELALTIAGISKKERTNKALNALEEVGLKEQAHKKPNQLSGGQMQRVAIARALVNDPDILLADEPTGALDSKTSIQVMELLKKVASDRLVVMVTHNPELAQQYANRIVKLQDGEIINDTNPLEDEIDGEEIKSIRIGRAKMNFFTALLLSFNNLLTKKGRTILTAFAGSIGIIGIALILSLSQGFQNYIDKIQEDTLSSYPLTVTSETADATSAILSMVSDKEKAQDAEENTVVEKRYLTSMFSSIGTNDMRRFKKYLDDNVSKYENDISLIKYSYSVSPNIYTIDGANNLTKVNPSSLMSAFYSDSAMSALSSFSTGTSIFSEMMDDEKTIKENYDLLKGKWPTNYDEMIIILSEPSSISDLLVYSLGLKDTNKLKSMMNDIMSGNEIDEDDPGSVYTYDDLLNLEFKLINNYETYKYNEEYDIYENMSEDNEYMLDLYNNSMTLKIVGIVCPKEDSSSLILSPGVGYKKDLTNYVIHKASNSDIVKKQLSNTDVDVISNKRFDEVNKDEKPTINFEDMISIDENMIKDAFKVNIDENSFGSTEDTETLVMNKSKEVAESLKETSSQAMETASQAYIEGITQLLEGYNVFAIATNPSLTTNIISYDENTINLYKTYAITEEVLQDPSLVIIANQAFDEYVDQIKKSSNFNQEDSTIDMTQIDVNAGEIAANIVGSEAVQGALFKKVNESLDEYTYLLVAKGVGEALGESMAPLAKLSEGELFTIDSDKFAKAFKFDMDQDQLTRIMQSLLSKTEDKTAKNNLISFGYQDFDDPTNISFFFKDFSAKENFLSFIDEYNKIQDDEEKQIKYTDITGLLMSSVKTIVDSVSYVLIAFVSISLIVSSIMIAVITLISVMERTKEIGILRAIGASKKNVSSIFNAETFIIGLLSGLIGVGVSLLSIIPINNIIHSLTDNYNINAVLPADAAITLILISVFLTMLAGLIPSRKAAKQDPVIALRSE